MPEAEKSRTEYPAVEIYTDGGCKPNPGSGGWAVLLRFGSVEKELSGGAAATTNNQMELTAAIEGLAALKFRCNVTLYTDSEYLRNGIIRWMRDWKRKGWKTASGTPVKNRELWERLDTLIAAHQVTWEWVKGHAGHEFNERVDKLASAAIEKFL